MEKVIQFLTDTEGNAYTVVETLKKLDATNDISIDTIYVLSKNERGKTTLKNSEGESADNTIFGAFAGGLLGLIGGPLGFLAGASLGGLTGSIFDLSKADDVDAFLKEISAKIPNGKSLVVAHVDEDWESPIDTKLSGIAQIKRINVDEEIDKAAQAEIDEYNKEIDEAEAARKQAKEEHKKEWQDKIDNLKAKRDAKIQQLKDKLATQKQAYKNWFQKLKAKLHNKK